MPFLTLNHLAFFLDQPIETLDQTIPITHWAVDSRLVKPGSVFVALKGARVNGNAFLSEAKFNGAIAAIVSEDYEGPDFDLVIFKVPNPLETFQKIASQVTEEIKYRIVAVSGSIGKTTSKDFLKTLLSTKFRVTATPGNANSQTSLPLTLLNELNGNEEVLVLEMGMTEKGNLTKLVSISPPEIALITTVTLVHACNFSSVNEIAEAKAELFSHPKTRLGIYLAENPNSKAFLESGRCEKRTFSISDKEADYFLSPTPPFRLKLGYNYSPIELGLFSLPGRHNLQNLLGAIAVAHEMGVEKEEWQQMISKLTLPERRLQQIYLEDILFINDAYNACELSVKAALESLSELNQTGKKVAVLGSMMELGRFSDECHHRVGETALKHVDLLFCLGEECRPMVELWKLAGKPVHWFLNLAALTTSLKTTLQPNDVVLLKGSKSKELWKILEAFHSQRFSHAYTSS